MNKINYDNYLYIEGEESGYMTKYSTLWETYLKLWDFVNDELNGLLEIISKELKEEN